MENAIKSPAKINTTTFSNKTQVPQTLGFTDKGIDRFNAMTTATMRYGLVIILLIFGFYKFFDFEARAIQPLVANSPLMSFLYNLLDLRGVSALIGSTEIIIALLIGFRPWYPRLSAAGSLAAVAMFVITLTFLISTPQMWSLVEGIIVPTDGGFLFKDVILLAASMWTAAEALRAAHNNSNQ